MAVGRAAIGSNASIVTPLSWKMALESVTQQSPPTFQSRRRILGLALPFALASPTSLSCLAFSAKR